MKTIFVDAVGTLIVGGTDGFGVFLEMYELLESFSNPKYILTSANDEQWTEFGLDQVPYSTFTLKHNPEKTDPAYYRKALEHFALSVEDVVYIEHNKEAVKSAESLGIRSYYYDESTRDLEALKQFLTASL